MLKSWNELYSSQVLTSPCLQEMTEYRWPAVPVSRWDIPLLMETWGEHVCRRSCRGALRACSEDARAADLEDSSRCV